MMFAIEFTLRGVLRAGEWRSEEELRHMTGGDMRNTLIVELSGHSNQDVGYFQRFDDDALVGKGAMIAFLKGARIRNAAALRDMSDEDQRNTLIAESKGHTGFSTSQLQGMGNQELVRLAFDRFARSVSKQWMKDRWEQIKDQRLWQLALPASHDSACYGKCWIGMVGAAIKDDCPRSQTQGANIYEQLSYGIRHFDLRFRRCNGIHYVMHGSDVFETKLADVLGDIRKFLDETEREILTLQFRFESGGLAQTEVIEALGRQRILSHEDVATLNRAWPANCTPAGLHQRGKRVVLLWDETQGLEDSKEAGYVWNSAGACDYIQTTRPHNFASAVVTEEIIEGRTRDLEWWRHNYRNVYFASQGQYWFGLGVHLTTVIAIPPEFEDHGHRHAPQYNLRRLAGESLPVVLAKLRGDWKREPWNLVGADLFTQEQYLEFVQAVIDLNKEPFQYDIPQWQ